MNILDNSEVDDAEFEADQFRSTAWAVNLADLMTFLMIFFLLLFSFYFSMSQSPEMKEKVEKSMKSIEKQFSGRQQSTLPNVIKVESKSVSVTDERSVPVKAVFMNKLLYFPYEGDLKRSDARKALYRAFLDSADKNSMGNVSISGVQVGSDETASYVVDRVVIFGRVIKEKVQPFIMYTVMHGDTLWAICTRNNLNPSKAISWIAKDNDIKNPSVIIPGDKLKIKIGPAKDSRSRD